MNSKQFFYQFEQFLHIELNTIYIEYVGKLETRLVSNCFVLLNKTLCLTLIQIIKHDRFPQVPCWLAIKKEVNE